MSSSMASIATLQKRVEEMLPGLSKAEAQVPGLVNAGKREKSERRAGERETKKVAERGKRRGSGSLLLKR